MASITNTTIGFTVKKIEKSFKKEGYVAVIVTFDNSPDHEYTFLRNNYKNSAVIDGCRIYFTDDLQVTKIVREVETSKKPKKSNLKTSSKNKKELEGKGIEVPKVVPTPQVKTETNDDSESN